MDDGLRQFLENLVGDNARLGALRLSEQATRQGAVQPILNRLGWDTEDTSQVFPEFPLDGRAKRAKAVDYCLLIDRKPRVFIEVKRAGNDLDDSAAEQLLGYSFSEGVQLAVLTNGLSWELYLPLKRGAWAKRKFYVIDISNQDLDTVTSHFARILGFENVKSDSSVKYAEEILESKEKRRIIKETLPNAWRELCVEPDEFLVELIQEKVESLCGYKPDLATVKSFLEGNLKLSPSESVPKEVERRAKRKAPPRKPATLKHPVEYTFSRAETVLPVDYTGTRPYEFTLEGKVKSVKSYTDVLVGVCGLLFQNHKDEFDKVLSVRSKQGNAWFSRNRDELTPSSDPKRIPGSSILVATNWPANNMIIICYQVMNLFGCKPKSLQIKCTTNHHV